MQAAREGGRDSAVGTLSRGPFDPPADWFNRIRGMFQEAELRRENQIRQFRHGVHGEENYRRHRGERYCRTQSEIG